MFDPHSVAGAISIHTPVKGVTAGRRPAGLDPLISIHTPVKGVTCHTGRATSSRYFNPHTREGCDGLDAAEKIEHSDFNPHTREGCDNPSTFDSLCKEISIHTPVKGVTEDDEELVEQLAFQSTHP